MKIWGGEQLKSGGLYPFAGKAKYFMQHPFTNAVQTPNPLVVLPSAFDKSPETDTVDAYI
ncbi:hypothetical protein Q5691_26720 [Microcoleus sp. w1-18aA5]|uniref:hypothetical protein n=1 Tax=unclassified Microcoleus TaxID=2642155 RepID=UPI002FD525A3